jgi:hypothetical protein
MDIKTGHRAALPVVERSAVQHLDGGGLAELLAADEAEDSPRDGQADTVYRDEFTKLVWRSPQADGALAPTFCQPCAWGSASAETTCLPAMARARGPRTIGGL